MKFLLDENVSKELAEALRRLGHEALMIREVLGPGSTNGVIIDEAVKGGYIVITCDTHFGDLVYKCGKEHAGVVSLRLKNQRAANQVKKVLEALNEGQIKPGAFVAVRG